MSLLLFVIKNALLGVGLAMDAFSVSIANALQDPNMRRRRAFLIAGTFAFFQCLMPLAGWVIVHTAAEHFLMFRNAIPIIAFVLLLFIGGKMIVETVLGDGEEVEPVRVSKGELFVQGIATSIDALSVGFTIATYTGLQALAASLIIAAVTLVICLAGIRIGSYVGMRLAGRASVFGGLILIAIGIRILVSGGF